MVTSIQYATIMKSKVLNADHMRIMVLAMLLSATLAPVAIAEVKWEEDNWLYTMGQEFLENGDEFGCYGMPNLEWKADPGAVAIECKEYISERIDASKWGSNPISTYTPSGLTASQHTIIANQGFMIHGDNTGQSAKAWHNSENEPINEYDWFNLGRRGGSLEKGIADVDRVENELDAGGFVNMYWIGRISDLNVRHDASVIDMVTERNDVWYTTWGEAYSYWTVERCHQFYHNLSESVLQFNHDDTTQCKAAAPNAWNVPVTWVADVGNTSVLNSTLSPMSEDDSNTREGWRQEGNILYFSVLRGHNVSFTLSDETEYDILGRTQFFNNKSVAFTITGHSTTDLFHWSKRFDDQEKLRFTWLISPEPIDEGIFWLPYAGFAVLAGSVAGIYLLVKKDEKDFKLSEALMARNYEGDDDE